MAPPNLEHAPRRRQPYTEHFRGLEPQQRADELTLLKKLYEDDKLSIRRIAALKESSYGFMWARLTDAGVNLTANSTSYVPPAQQDQP